MGEERKLFDVPNLDDLSTGVEDYAEAASVLALLAQYAALKRTAVADRAAGNVAGATAREHEMEALYWQLPKWARW